ncbi:insulin-like growth factor 1 receptor [Ptychodera flava]|uniref:insulin-like growth factor 1 receptor n=1 Tax=Ptychodera flava TaxID=63121 RepID=UPI00396A0BE7
MSMKGVMHKDIAARNVFLTKDFTAKIGDFGLGRDVYERLGSDYLTPTWANQQCRFPLRWMPPEFLNDGTFTLESDIWSYGILLWEIASLGGSPMTDVPVAKFTGVSEKWQKTCEARRMHTESIPNYAALLA